MSNPICDNYINSHNPLICNRCKKCKTPDMFSPRIDNTFLLTTCKDCMIKIKNYMLEKPEIRKKATKKYYDSHKEKQQIYRDTHKEETKEYNRKYSQKNKTPIIEIIEIIEEEGINKTCTMCNTIKDLEFFKKSVSTNIYFANCKDCLYKHNQARIQRKAKVKEQKDNKIL